MNGGPDRYTPGRPSRPGRAWQAGFSLIELLVAISVIALLIAVLLPALDRVRGAAKDTVCLSQLRQLGIAQSAYLNEHRGRFWRYYESHAGGRRWWFGFEPGGPGTGSDRPLDKSGSVLAPYLSTLDDAFNCPVFPYDDPMYFPKFERRAASYGFNLLLGPASQNQATVHRDEVHQPARVFTFADGIHFDFNPGFNEGHYISLTPGANSLSGYAHFRHQRRAHAAMMDGSVRVEVARDPLFASGQDIGPGPVGNLPDQRYTP